MRDDELIHQALEGGWDERQGCTTFLPANATPGDRAVLRRAHHRVPGA